MEAQIKQVNTRLTYMAEQAVINQLLHQHHRITEVLENIDCEQYTSSIKKIVVILIAFQPDETAEPEKLYLRKNKTEIEIRANLNYAALLQANDQQTTQLVAQAYLQAVERFLSQRKDFDYQRFYKDISALFREKGYIQ